MRNLLAIFLVLLIIVIFIWARLKIITSRIDINIKLGGLKLKDFVKGVGSGNDSLKTDLIIFVTNNNNFSIPISSLYIELYHKGKLVGRSLDLIENKYKVKIPALGTVSFEHFVEIFIIDEFFNLLGAATTGKFDFDYKIKMKVFAVPLTVEDTFEIKEEE